MQISLQSPKSNCRAHGVCPEHATSSTSVLPLDSEHRKAVTAIGPEGAGPVPRTTSSKPLGHQGESQRASEAPARSPSQAQPRSQAQPGPERACSGQRTSRPRPAARSGPFRGRSRTSASRFLKVPPASGLPCSGVARVPFPWSARTVLYFRVPPPEVTHRKPLSRTGRGRKMAAPSSR